MTLASRWPLRGCDDLRDALLAAWDDASRGYHDRVHLGEVLDRLDELAASGVGAAGSVEVVLAAWFHDAVYDGGPDAEDRSARWAEEALAGLLPEVVVGEVARLVRLTTHHQPEPGDLAGAALCDADLAILASPPARYAAYLAGVRKEYAHLSDAVFASGRRAVVADLLSRPRLFSTPYARAHWESLARANLTAELAPR